MTRNLISIGRFSMISRLSVRMLRHYDQLGLLRPAWVDPDSGYRYYTHEQASTAEVIRLLRSLGMPLEGIRSILDANTPHDMRSKLADFRREVEDHLAATQRTLDYLEALVAFIDEADVPNLRDVSLREMPALTIVSRRESQPMDDLGRWIGASFGVLGAHMAATAGQMAGPPGTIYHGIDGEENVVDVEAFAPIVTPVAAASGIHCRELAGGLVAGTLHMGPYETIGRTYVLLSAWIQHSSHEPAGPPREIYLSDPVKVPDPANYETELLWPVL